MSTQYSSQRAVSPPEPATRLPIPAPDPARNRPSRLFVVATLCVLAVIPPAKLLAQSNHRFASEGVGEGRLAEPLRTGLPDIRRGFTFCRLQYTSDRYEAAGLGWSTDYPTGDENFLIRLSQLTTTDVSVWKDGVPGHAVLRATNPDLFRCPFLFASDVGTLAFSDEEVAKLRQYFRKGGFLWVDDFWGEQAWQQWTEQIQRVLPGLTIVELGPEHPLYAVSYRVKALPQIANISFWERTGGETSERGVETEHPSLHGIFDASGRLMVLMSHNTDIADGWEREWQSNLFFQTFSPRAYGMAINIAIWVMTH